MHCPGRPLTYSTRLHWPSEDPDDGIDGEADDAYGTEIDGETRLEEIGGQIELVNCA
jgi:hypothetical protein